MIGRTNCGAGGGGTVGVTIYGGANEVITYSGKASGTFTLDSAGAGTVELKKGVYTFTAGLSGLSISKACENGTVVRLRPDHYIYWYGAINGVINKYDSYGALTFGANTFTFQASGENEWCACQSDVDCSQDAKLSVRCTTVESTTYSDLLYASYKNNTGGTSARLKANDTTSLTYTYAANRKPMLAVFNGNYTGRKIIAQEWYLGNREAG